MFPRPPDTQAKCGKLWLRASNCGRKNMDWLQGMLRPRPRMHPSQPKSVVQDLPIKHIIRLVMVTAFTFPPGSDAMFRPTGQCCSFVCQTLVSRVKADSDAPGSLNVSSGWRWISSQSISPLPRHSPSRSKSRSIQLLSQPVHVEPVNISVRISQDLPTPVTLFASTLFVSALLWTP